MSDLLAWHSIIAICLHSPNGADFRVSAQEILDARLPQAFHAPGRSALGFQTRGRRIISPPCFPSPIPPSRR